MRHLSGLLVLLFAMSGCGGGSSPPPEPSPTTDTAAGMESMVGIDIPDDDLVAGGLTPVRTMAAACSLLFDDRDVPALAAGKRADNPGAVDTDALQDILTSVAYSGPDVLRDDAGALIDHLDLPPTYLDAGARAEAQEQADRLAAHCAEVRD